MTPEAPGSHTVITGTIETDGFHLGYSIHGTGKPALVIGSARYYSRTFSANIAKHLRLVCVDHRGFVPPPGPLDNTAYDLDVLLDDVERVRRTLGLEQVIVIGHSGHGYMALEYAKKYPAQVSHVVLIAMGPDQSAPSHQAADEYWEALASPARKAAHAEHLRYLPAELQAAPERRFITLCIRMNARYWYDYTFDPTPLWEGVHVNMPMIDYVWGTVFRDIDITQGLDGFDKPVFLALGRYDFLVAPPASWEPIRPRFKDLTTQIFERSGHVPQYEEPERFDAELLRWLSEKPRT